MKARVLQENLSKALTISSRFSSSKAQLPVLSNVLLQSKKNKLLVSATNLETSIAISIGAKVEKEGKITVPAKTISELVSNLGTGQVDLEAKKERLSIATSRFKSTISGMNANDFPVVLQSVGKDGQKMPVNDFLQGLAKVLFAVSIDETRPVLTGVLILIEEDSLTFVSTDGFRLSRKKIKLKSQKSNVDNIKIILPKAVLVELSRIGADDDEFVFSFNSKDNQVVFGMSDTVLSSRLIEGEFPNFEKIIPSESAIEIFVDKNELAQAVKLASVFAKDSANVVKFNVGKDAIKVIAESQLSGSQESEVDAKIEGNTGTKSAGKRGFVIAFNYRFLEDFLSSCESDDVVIKLTDSNAPTVFLDPKDKNYLHIIMPVKI